MPAGARVTFAVARMSLLERGVGMEVESSMMISLFILVYSGTMLWAFLGALASAEAFCHSVGGGVRGPDAAAAKDFFLAGSSGARAIKGAGGGAGGDGAGAAGGRWEKRF